MGIKGPRLPVSYIFFMHTYLVDMKRALQCSIYIILVTMSSSKGEVPPQTSQAIDVSYV